jgi:secreted trypsin-like serine protease
MSPSLRPRVAASLVLAASLLALRPGPARSRPDDSVRVVGGQPAADGRFPFMVSLQKPGASGASAHFCGGSLIDREWVLTAGHCVRGQTAGQFRIVVGATRLSAGDGEVRAPVEIRVHPGYDGNATHGADVALVRLSTPVDDIAPLEPVRPAERAKWEAGERATVVGWGVTSEAGTVASDQLLAASLPIQPDAVMTAPDGYGDRFLPSDMIGAGPVEGGSDACFGDSGGPLVIGRGATLRQIGIVSFGRGCGRQPGVYSRLGEGRVRAFADSLIPLRVAPVRGREGSPARFTLTLARGSTVPASFSWETVGETAREGVDFAGARGVVEFTPGHTAASIDVSVTADKRVEPDETFRLELSKPVNVWLAGTGVEGTVVDAS